MSNHHLQKFQAKEVIRNCRESFELKLDSDECQCAGPLFRMHRAEVLFNRYVNLISAVTLFCSDFRHVCIRVSDLARRVFILRHSRNCKVISLQGQTRDIFCEILCHPEQLMCAKNGYSLSFWHENGLGSQSFILVTR